MKLKLYLRLFWINIYTRIGLFILLTGAALFGLVLLSGIHSVEIYGIVFVVNYAGIWLLMSCGFGYSTYKEYRIIMKKHFVRKIPISENYQSIYPCFTIAHKVAYSDIKNNTPWV